MKISLVTAYYNRKQLLFNTLKSIEYHGHKDVEIIVIDDASNEDQRLTDFLEEFDLNLRIFRVEPETKWWINPCIPFNMGFKKATGDVIILQNPECLHHGDIITHVQENIQENEYLNFGCYSVDGNVLAKINEVDYSGNMVEQLNTLINPMTQRGIHRDGENAWYNHSQYRARQLHFCSAITRKDLEKIGGGFDDRYAYGVAFDDDDFIFKIKKAQISIKMVDDPFVLHQFHGATNTRHNWQLVGINHKIYNETLMKG